MIILASDGLTSEEIIKKIRDNLVHITDKAALVTTASNYLKERDSNVPILTEILGTMGLECSCVDVEFEDISVLLGYDVVILMGGDPFYLRRYMNQWKSSYRVLKELADHRVLVGISAGSMVLGTVMDFAAGIEPGILDERNEWYDTDGYGLVPYGIFPHNMAYLTVYPGIDKRLEAYEKETGIKLRRINDAEAIICEKSGRVGKYLKNKKYTPKINGRKKRLRVKNIVFDLYGTLIDIHTDEDKSELWNRMALYYSYRGALWTSDELRRSFELYLNDEKNNAQRIIGEEHIPEPQIEKVFEKLFCEKGVKVSEQDVQAAAIMFRVLSVEYVRLYYGAEKLLKSLKKHGYRLFVLSNAQSAFTNAEINYLGIHGYFDKICLSSDYYCKKPDYLFFEQLLESEQLNAEETLMIGNSMNDDIVTARKIGMKTCYLYSNLSDPKDDPECDISFGVMDLPGVEKILCARENNSL